MIDWAAKWFEIRAEMGQSDMATMMYKDDGQDWKEVHFRHRDTDGFGKIQSLLQNDNIKIEAPIRPLKKPFFLLQPFLLIKGILIHPKLSHNPWKNFTQDLTSLDPSEVSSWHLSEGQNKELKARAEKAKVNLGFYILWEIDSRVKKLLYSNQNDKGTWLCPVDVRGAYPEIPKSQNCVSFITVETKGTNIQSAFQKYRSSLKNKTYWAFWELYQIGKWIGLSGMKKLAKRTQGKSFWMGSFSDLGNWNQENLRNSKARNRKWVIAPPGSPSYPIGVTTIEWCGSRSITLKIHPSISGGLHPVKISDAVLFDFEKSITPTETDRGLSIGQ